MHNGKMNTTSISLEVRNQFVALLDYDKQVINVLKSFFHQCFKIRNILVAVRTSWTDNPIFYDTYCCMQYEN